MEEILGGSIIISLCGGAFALVLGALGVLLIVLYIHNKKKTSESRNWSATTGRIVLSDVSMIRNENGDFSRNSFIPKIGYEYEVEG